MYVLISTKKVTLFKKFYGITIFIAIKETYLFCDIMNRIVISDWLA